MSVVVAVVMGVSGSGKTAVGEALAARLGWRFLDADDLHSEAAKRQMARGEALTDADRQPWLLRVRAEIAHHVAAREGLVLACSALKVSYRQVLARPHEPVRFLWLDAPEAVLRERLQSRDEHFATDSLLPSQLNTLEPPAEEDAVVRIDASLALRDVIAAAEEAVLPPE